MRDRALHPETGEPVEAVVRGHPGRAVLQRLGHEIHVGDVVAAQLFIESHSPRKISQ